MSSTSNLTLAPTPTSTDDGEDHQPQGGSSTSSNLYLFTFLATLFLLVIVSCAIVLRSFVLRRRFRRRIDEAIQAGLIQPRAQGSKRRRVGARPKFHDAWLMSGGETWDEMMPLSAQRVKPRRSHKDGESPRERRSARSRRERSERRQAHHSGQAQATSRFLALWSHPHIEPYRPPPTSPASPPSSPRPNESKTPLTDTDARPEMLQISVLVAMPSPRRFNNTSTSSFGEKEDDQVGDLAIGVIHLPCKLDRDEPTSDENK